MNATRAQASLSSGATQSHTAALQTHIVKSHYRFVTEVILKQTRVMRIVNADEKPPTVRREYHTRHIAEKINFLSNLTAPGKIVNLGEPRTNTTKVMTETGPYSHAHYTVLRTRTKSASSATASQRPSLENSTTRTAAVREVGSTYMGWSNRRRS